MTKFIVGFVASAILASFLVLSSQGSPILKRLASDRVIEKLDRYAEGAKSSDLTMADLEAAQREFNSWSPRTLEELRATDRKILLLVHFLYLPQEKFPIHTIEGVSDIDVQKHFIERLELNYKRFKPAYFGAVIGSRREIRCLKSKELIKALGGIKDHKPLTELLYKRGKDEYDSIKLRAEEMAEYEDIYALLGEYEVVLNYLNNPLFQVLAESIFPIVKVGVNFNPEELSELYKRELLSKKRIIVEDGSFRLAG